MASRSESLSGISGFKRGIPINCHCGGAVKKYTSTTAENPGRPFYRCESMSKKGLKQGHLFKWVEDALIEEIEELKGRDGVREDETTKLRSDFDSIIHEIYDIHQNILEGNKQEKKFKTGLAIGFCVGVMVMVFLW